MKKAILALLMIFGLTAMVSAEELPTSEGVVVQVNGDTADFKRALTLASNMRAALPKAKFEVVVYGANVKLLTAFSDEAPLVQKVLDEGIRVIACGRSLKSEHLVNSDLASGVTVVPFGAVHIVNRQKQGWQYIKG
ncbi:MAG: DsrE family protein [Thiobacillus sp.]|nr:DsrE family protein [Thiobacillus sp.]